jgi:hypothetical protein
MKLSEFEKFDLFYREWPYQHVPETCFQRLFQTIKSPGGFRIKLNSAGYCLGY